MAQCIAQSAFDLVAILALHSKPKKHLMRSLFVLIFALSMIACGDGDHRPENQSSNPLYPSGPEQVQRGQIMTGEGSVVSEAEVVIIDAERLVVLARAPVDDRGGFVVSVPQRPSYWLGVSGPYMATHIDTTFAFTGEAITVDEAPRSYPAGKAAQVVGILGDVNNDNQVDIADALLVLLYTLERFSFVAPNQGNIALGDVNEDGLINLADVLLIMTYIANPLDPTLPDGIGLATEQTAVAVAVEQDRAVLIALYEATGGDNWKHNTNWLISTSPLDQWYGVATDDAGRVASLYLADNQLTGPILEAVGNLNSLQYLNLTGNQLTGEIPQALGQLNNLKYLDLGYNQLTGLIPGTLGQLDSLQVLDLGYNQLTGTIPKTLGQLDSLQVLDLGYNQLTGTIPKTLGQLDSLQSLDLTDNQLTGEIPQALGQLNNLQSLNLGYNQLTGTIPETLGQLNNLQVLDLTDNQLTGEIPQALGQLNNLQHLNLTDNQLTGCIPSALLDVSVNDLNDPRPAFCLPGRADPISIFTVSFPSNDGVEVSALFGTAQDGESLPVVILLHDLGGSKADWMNNTGTYVALLERGYSVLAIDMRGHGDTPIPDDRQFLEVIDIELSYRDVEAAMAWLPSQSEIDVSRIAVVGSGSGGNVAYVSSGLLPEQIKTSVSLSPGLWHASSFEPVVTGAGLEPFDPRSILFMAADKDQIDTGDVILSYAEFARSLEALTAEPKDLRIFPDSADHGFELLDNIAEAHDLFFLWLEENL